MSLSELLDKWDTGDVDLLLFEDDQAMNNGECTSLHCIFTPGEKHGKEAAPEFVVPPALAEMHHLIFSVGPSGQGLPFHSHGASWQTLIYGRKLWVLYPPDAVPASVRHRSVKEVLRGTTGPIGSSENKFVGV